MSVNLEYYRTFYNVATLGSMGKAAELMCLTPPTVTKTIQALEQQLGCQLFTRSARGVRLTAAGEALYLRVKPGLKLLDAGEHEVNMLNSLEGGTVRLAAGVAAIHHFTMPAVLETFCTRYPKVRLVIKHLSSSAAQEAILSGDIDFAILNFPPDYASRDFSIHPLYRADNVAVVGKKYAFLADEPISLDTLSQFPLIFPESGYTIRESYEQLYRKLGQEFRPNIETPTLDTQLRAVSLGLGYSFMPYPHVREGIENGELFLLDIEGVPALERTACLLTPKDAPMSRAADALVEIILSAADEFSSN